MPRFDRFDLITIIAIAALVSAAIFIGVTDTTSSVAVAAKKAAAAPMDPGLSQKVESARLLLESGQPREAIDGLKAVEAAAPAYPEPHALLGLSYSKTMDYTLAVREFRLALSIDPSYADSKSPKFIGKRIKTAVKEARRAGASAAALNDIQYIDRMLAGGCE